MLFICPEEVPRFLLYLLDRRLLTAPPAVLAVRAVLLVSS
jgi:hypothetical protein